MVYRTKVSYQAAFILFFTAMRSTAGEDAMSDLLLVDFNPKYTVEVNVERLSELGEGCIVVDAGLTKYDCKINGSRLMIEQTGSTTKALVPLILLDISNDQSIASQASKLEEIFSDADYIKSSAGGVIYIYELKDRQLLLSKGQLTIRTN